MVIPSIIAAFLKGAHPSKFAIRRWTEKLRKCGALKRPSVRVAWNRLIVGRLYWRTRVHFMRVFLSALLTNISGVSPEILSAHILETTPPYDRSLVMIVLP